MICDTQAIEHNITLIELGDDEDDPRVEHGLAQNRNKDKILSVYISEGLMAEILGHADRFKLFHYYLRNRVDLIIPGLISRNDPPAVRSTQVGSNQPKRKGLGKIGRVWASANYGEL